MMPLLHAGFMVSALLVAGGSGASAAADFELGRYLAGECVTCHRAGGDTSAIPDIFGWSEEAITDVMVAYREKRLPNPVMQNVAGRLSDEEVASLALYFARTKKP